MSQRVEIRGGGFSGLTLAYYLTQLGVSVVIKEKTDRLGGLIDTHKESWGLSEAAATGVLNSHLVEDLFRDLKIEKADSTADAKKRYIFRAGLRRWPLNFFETLRFLFGLLAILIFSPLRVPKVNESINEYVSRRLGRSAFEFLVSPALQGIYSTSEINAELLLDSWQKKSADRGRPVRRGTVAPRGGMGEICKKLKDWLLEKGQTIETNTTDPEVIQGPVVLAVPATVAAIMLSEAHPELAGELAKIKYLPITTVTASFSKRPDDLKAFGCLFPSAEKFNSLGVLVNSTIFSDRGPADRQIETWIFNKVDMINIEEQIIQDRSRIIEAKSDKPVQLRIQEWPHGIPHYDNNLNHFRKNLKLPVGVYLTGNYLGRIGLAKILALNFQLAQEIRDNL